MAAKVLLRRLHFLRDFSAMGGMWLPNTPVARYSTLKKNGEVAPKGEAQQRSKKKKSAGILLKTSKKSSRVAIPVGECSEVGDSAYLQHEQKGHRDVEGKTATALSSSPWSPTVSDYESLVVNLLLYRQESLESVLSALRKERTLFDETVKVMEGHIAEMYAVREEIREMLMKGATEQRQALLEALSTDGGTDRVAGEAEDNVGDAFEDEDEDEGEIFL